jgi:hypothetical protein
VIDDETETVEEHPIHLPRLPRNTLPRGVQVKDTELGAGAAHRASVVSGPPGGGIAMPRQWFATSGRGVGTVDRMTAPPEADDWMESNRRLAALMGNERAYLSRKQYQELAHRVMSLLGLNDEHQQTDPHAGMAQALDLLESRPRDRHRGRRSSKHR